MIKQPVEGKEGIYSYGPLTLQHFVEYFEFLALAFKRANCPVPNKQKTYNTYRAYLEAGLESLAMYKDTTTGKELIGVYIGDKQFITHFSVKPGERIGKVLFIHLVLNVVQERKRNAIFGLLADDIANSMYNKPLKPYGTTGYKILPKSVKIKAKEFYYKFKERGYYG